MKKIIFSTLAILSLAGAGFAEPIDLPEGTPLRIQFDNAEQIDTSLSGSIDVPGTLDYGTADNWGIIKVSNISIGGIEIPNTQIGGGGDTIFTDGVDGQISGIFYGVDITGCSGSGTAACTATGGVLDLYWNDAGVNDLGVVSSYAPTDATVDAFTDGTFLVRLLFDSGVINGDADTTLTSSINLTESITGEGTANGFLSVDTSTPGAWTSILNGDWFFVDPNGNTVFGEAGETRDMRFRNTFNLLPSWNGTNPDVLGFSSTDPATVLTASEEAPEPATLTLLGLGLAGLARSQRRRIKA